ncbi:MAG: choice-of-anchor D domain-containing protein, partial [Ignavibacteria bacterium]|nr:choice-of-anchor D domain-containing protein [Ignavibacteria bacterium]
MEIRRNFLRNHNNYFLFYKITIMMLLRFFISIILFFCFCRISTFSDTTTVGGNITTNTTWSTVNSPYRVISEVLVFNGAMLTIEAGVTVLFDSGTGLRIGKSGSFNSDAGSLIALGTASDSIRFTSSSEDTAQWKGIVFDNGSDVGGSNSVLAFCVFERAGETNTNADNEKANVFCKNTNTPSIANSAFRNSDKYELYCSNANPSITQSSFSNSTTVSTLVLLKSNSSPTFSHSSFSSASATHLLFCDSSSYPTLTNNFFISENAKAMRVGILSLFSANNFSALAHKGIEIIGGTLNANRIWSKQISESTYIVLQRDISVSNGTNPTLTIDSGVVVKFSNVGLRIGGISNSNEGKLIANGTVTDSVRFTSESGNINGWKGILFDDGSDKGGDSSVIKYGIIENAGLPNVYNISSNIHTKFSTSTVISNSTIRNANGYELFCDSSASGKFVRTDFSHSTYVYSIVYLKNNSAPTFYNCTFVTDSSSYVIYSELSNCTPIVSECIFSNAYGKSFRVGVLSQIIDNNVSRVAVKGMEILGGIFNQNRTWKKQPGDSMYVVLGNDISIRNGNNPTLTLDSGIIVKFLGVGLTIGGSTSTDEGILIANGSASQPVYFTSASGTSGGWKGLLFESGSDYNTASSLLSYCVIENAGQLNTYGAAANIYCRNTRTPVIHFSTIKNSSGIGVYCSASSPTLKNSQVIFNTQYGIDVSANSSPLLGNTLQYSNDIYGNGQYEVYVEGTQNINARYNYWGTTNQDIIASRIFDKTDNASLGEVLFKPYTDSSRTVLLPDVTPPINPTIANGFSDSLQTLQLISARAYNYSHPYFIWNSGRDSNSFVAGYAIALTSDSSDTLLRIITTNDTSLTVVDDLTKETNYYFRIRTKDVYENWSNAVTLFRYYYDSLAPVVPLLLYANGGNGNVTLRWNKNIDGDFFRYRIFHGINPNPSIQVDSVSNRNDTMKTISNLPNGTTQYFRITSVDTLFNESSFSNELSATPIQPPSIPTLFSPNNGATHQSVLLSFVWNSAVGAQTYRLQVSPDSNFAATFFDDSTITETSQQVETLSVATNYYWRVKAKNAGGISDWSQRWKFKTVSLPKFSINKTFILFDSVYVDSTQSDSVVISNTGTELLHLTSTSENNHFSVIPTIDSISPSAAKTFFVSFHPTSLGNKTGKIIFIHDGLTSPDTIFAAGAGIAPSISLSTLLLSLDSVLVNTSNTDSFFISNPGSATLNVTNVSCNTNAFIVTPNNFFIEPDDTQKVFVTFTPSNAISYNGIITIEHNASGNPTSLLVTGTGITPSVFIFPATLFFSEVIVNTTKLDSITITNTGTAELVVTNITSTHFTYSASPTNFILSPNQNKKIYISFSPVARGTINASVKIFHNAVGGFSSVSVSGLGIAPQIVLVPTSLSFGNVIVHQFKQDSFSVANSGAAPLEVTNIISSDSTFSIHPTNFTVAPSENRIVIVTFSPATTGNLSGHIVLSHNATGTPDTVFIFGNGSPPPSPALSYSPQTISFDSVVIQTQKRDSFFISNGGNAQLIVSNIFSDNTVFSVDTNTFSLSPSTNKKIDVTFFPATLTTYSGNIIFLHNAYGSPDTLKVFGKGIPPPSPTLFLTNDSLSFGNVRLHASKKDSMTIRNSGTALLTGKLYNSESAFVLSTDTFFLQPNKIKNIPVTFSPDSAKQYISKIQITHNASGSPDTVIILGRGYPFPIMYAPDTAIWFGSVLAGNTKTDTIIFYNQGTAPLYILNIDISNTIFSTEDNSFTVAPNDSHLLIVQFTPVNEGVFQSSLVLSHDADGSPTTILLSGVGKKRMNDGEM